MRRREALDESEVDGLYRLYACYYAGTDARLFAADLAEKDHVVLLRDAGGEVQGFSTLKQLTFEFGGAQGRALFSGDTVVAHPHWGSQTLPLAWCRLAGKIKAEAPQLPLYWFLIVKGQRTYRYLPLFARRFYPTWREPTPPAIQALMDFLARAKFGEAYDPGSGLIRFARSRGHLRVPWADIEPALADKPDVRFFLERNPGHARGDELVCLTELVADNLRSHALRAFTAGLESAGQASWEFMID